MTGVFAYLSNIFLPSVTLKCFKGANQKNRSKATKKPKNIIPIKGLLACLKQKEEKCFFHMDGFFRQTKREGNSI